MDTSGNIEISGSVGIGTASPRTSLEVSLNASGKLGPVITLTNPGGDGGAAIDMNTFNPSGAGTYNPSSRIVAVDIGKFANNIVFQSNTPGAPNNKLVERLRLSPSGVGINSTSPPLAPLHRVAPALPNANLPVALIEANSTNNPSPHLGLVDTSLGSNSTAPVWFIDNSANTFRIFVQQNYAIPGNVCMSIGGSTVPIGIGQVLIGSGTYQGDQLGVTCQVPSEAEFFNAIGAYGYTAPVGSNFDGGPAITCTGGDGDSQINQDESGTEGGIAGTFNGGNGNQYGGAGIFAVGGTGSLAQNGADGPAGLFQGDVGVNGEFSASTKLFKIDHPLDPANKYLLHSSVESSEMLNVYSGNVTTDAQGEALVELPEWFEVLNTDFRYHLTVIGQFAQAIVSKKITDNQFTIRTDKRNVEVSWQVTGVRQDAYAKAHPLITEQEKDARDRGHYIHPELHGASERQSMTWARYPRMMKKIEQIKSGKLAGSREKRAER
jgi:hypothetical protein